MAAATPEEAKGYRAQVEELKRQYYAGLLRANLVSLVSGNFSPLGAAYQALTGEGLAQDMEAVRQDMLTLEQVSLPRILAGQRENGTPYVPYLFQTQAEQVGRGIERLTGEAWNSSLFGQVRYVPHDTAETAKDAGRAVVNAAQEAVAPFVPDSGTRDSLLFWAKVLGGGAVAASLIGAVARLVRR